MPNGLDAILTNLGAPLSMAVVFAAGRYRHDLERQFVGTTDVLNRLKSRFRLGIIANQSAGTAQRMCDHGWRDVFSVCISSTEENLNKPDPAIFQLAMDRASCLAGHALMVGDRIDNDIAPAKALGMATVRIRQGMAAVRVPRDLSQEADVTIDAIYHLPVLLNIP
jgi:putative hydrolase of the HAD superfamily